MGELVRIGVLVLVGGVLGMAGCAVRQPVSMQAQPATAAMQTKFDYGEHEPYTRMGSSIITGQGFLRQAGGGIVTCAGSNVLLMPATSFFREFIEHLRAGKTPQYNGTIDSRYRAMIKESQCDAQGKFSFSQLPGGAWLVLTEVKWEVRYLQQGGALMREVTLGSGDTVQVLLTERDFAGR